MPEPWSDAVLALAPDQSTALAAELPALLARYLHGRARWRAAPRCAEIRERFTGTAEAIRAAAERLGELRPVELELAGLVRGQVAAAMAFLDGLAPGFLVAAEDLERRGGGKGGARHALALVEPPPRAVLLLALARLLERHGLPVTTSGNSLLLRLAAALLEAAGEAEPWRGLRELARSVLQEPRENRPELAPVLPS
jgi:hypothetical protein